MVIPCLCSFRFSSCTAHHKTAVIPVDSPTRWEPRAKQQPTGLIAYGAARRRPVRFPYGSNKKSSAHCAEDFYDPYGNRTHVTAVKGPCLNRLTNGP